MEQSEGDPKRPQKQPWGKLVRLGAEGAESDILLLKREWTIGRRKGCDLSFPSNKLVSGDHCKIMVDEKSGQVSLEDTSTNGTVINKLKVVKKQTCPLQTGDVIYVVYRKNEPEHNVAYLYESLSAKQDVSQEPSEANVENSCHTTKDTSSTGRSDEIQVMPSLPATQTCYEEPQPSTSTSNLFNTSSTSLMESASTEREHPSTSGPTCLGTNLEEHSQFAASDETSNFTSAPVNKEETLALLLEPEGPDELEDLEPVKKKMKGDGDANLDLETLVAGQCKNNRVSPEDVKVANMKPDKMEETLTCIICQELLHDCVSLQPCMHTFCAACYSGWMERSSLCPTCRCPVERICKNHILNNLVEAYLIQHPEKCRNEEDVRSMDARNKITQDMLQPKVRRSFSDEEGSSEDLLELSDVDSESSDISQPYIVCRQCPGYRRHAVPPLPCPAPESEAGALPALGDAPSTSASFPAVVQEYVCPSQGSHAICTCCFQPMPDRRAEREQNPHVAPQQCTVCLQLFCHLYWGCTRMGCFGCLAPFCEINLGEKCLDGVLNNNNHESDILKNYLASRGLTWKNMLNESLLALQRGVFMLSDYRITGNTVLCYCCGLRSFRELTYQYRQNIPASELPVTVTSRPDCYWGRNCRTQVKAHHAMKFNHICEQTRFKN
ncbi:E3 ubiquitin-protein ligase CHFR isoform X2 [Tachyglossus aculeatus]|uniref:E3 ubiquitin-protein ligase CHFR isoform X2 n=1 Tax=Tachyglossus aculeatus TaxID=9261 RepID=UPI0018F3EDD3|nr:E3 ubiquitin-protein ligase CHFR isoform X2 [Tachyglossus aculeatus]XP_038618387.1 E3 ubiquitin-protein ligase CHFR isoform X2 [Tachyglossus aculeatus]XP_038618388.1 E3 ubiquitin-protein ligase CHFR isoform X2 [Tachyglossus aculeatus]